MDTEERIACCHGSQCGFCTPGMVMSMYTLLRNNPQPTEEEMEANLRGTSIIIMIIIMSLIFLS